MAKEALPLNFTGNRMLAAIVFTDGVNFSARMSENEEHTLELIRRDLQMMSELCQQFEGQVLKTTGDGLLMYFSSAIQAVACAVEIQKFLAESATNLSPQDILAHRIGIHLGDVFFSNSDVMGNGVNIAARLQTIAQPGGICMSQTVYDVVKGGLSLQATYLGPQALKNIQEMVPVYQILLATPAAGTTLESKVHPPEARLSRQAYRNRQILLNKVKNYWLKGVLETSLHGRALIELGLEERLNTVDRPWGVMWETKETSGEALPPGTKLIDKFDELGAGGTLLILGEPGAGKTTTLLELTSDLIHRAEKDMNQPMSVVFNLSSWTKPKQSLAEWLILELYTKYQVSQEIGKTWLEEQQLLLLLDGLDELKADRRDACVQAINEFSQKYGQTEIVVCSRIKDYEALSTRFRFQGAIYLQPLTQAQIHQYLTSAGSEFEALRAALSTDPTLQELASSPLTLSIMTLAYQGVSTADLPQVNLEERRKHLFNTYIERMFNRRSADQSYSKEQAKRWLIWLAQRMVQHSQTVFLIERLQPSWLKNRQQKWLYAIGVALVAGVIFGLGAGLNISMILGMDVGLMAGLILGVAGGLIAGLIFGVLNNQINPVETLKWSGEKARKSLRMGFDIGLIFGGLFGLSTGLISVRILGLIGGVRDGLLFGLTAGIGVGLIFILLRGLNGPVIEMRTIPNQGIRQSAINGAIFAGMGSLTVGLMAYQLNLPILFGIVIGLLFGLFGAGEACFQHFILRLLLYAHGYIPWNYARFLDWATERIFLQKVGGGYIFIHRLLLEHFAQMPRV